MKRLHLTLAITLFSLYNLHAQCLAPSISIRAGFYPAQNLKDTSGTFAHQRMNIKLATPLIKGFNVSNAFRFYLVSFVVAAAVDKNDLSIASLHRKFYTGNASLHGIYRTSKKNMWAAAFTTSLFEDEYTIHQPEVRASGFALYRRSVSESFFYMLGGAYSFTFGRGIPLPILGAGWRFTNRALLSVMLPFSVQYKFGKEANQFAIFVKPNGGISNMSSNSLFVNAPQTVMFRKREFTIGIKKRFKISDRWSLLAETGLLTGRQLYVTSNNNRKDDTSLLKTKVRPGPYISVGIRYKLKSKQKIETSEYSQSDIDYINDMP